MCNNRAKHRESESGVLLDNGANGSLSSLDTYLKDFSLAFDKCQNWKFFSANKLQRLKDLHPILLLKIEEPADLNNILISPDYTKLEHCRLHYVYSAGLLFGYIIEAHKYIVYNKENHVSIIRQSAKSVKEFTGVTVTAQTRHLTVLSSANASLITFNERYSYIEPSYLRVGAKSSNTDKQDD